MLRLTTLGGLAIVKNGIPLLDGAGSRTRLALLAFLCDSTSTGVSRERLLGVFWAESDEERARGALRQALYSLRRDLACEELTTSGNEIRLNPATISCDLWDFRQAISRGDHAAVVAAYGGSFLDGVFLRQAPEFERWMEGVRAESAAQMMTALEQLAIVAEGQHDYDKAVHWWRRAAVADRLSARVAVRLMRALAAAGDTPAALEHARMYAALLRAELDAPCDPNVTALAASLQSTPQASLVSKRHDAERDVVPAVAAPETSAQHVRASEREESTPNSLPRVRRIVAGAVAGIVAVLVLGSLVKVRLASDREPSVPAYLGPVPKRTVAILPLTSLTASPDAERLAEGISYDLIARLSTSADLRVVTRTEIRSYAGGETDVRRIGKALHATFVVVGNLRWVGDRVRVVAQVVDVGSGGQLWAGTFERQATDVFALQRLITEQLAQALGTEIAGAAIAETDTDPRRLSAYEYYLLGERVRTGQSRGRLAVAASGSRVTVVTRQDSARVLFVKALALDSLFAPAWAALGQLDGARWRLGLGERWFDSSVTKANRAIQLDPGLSDPYFNLAAGYVLKGFARRARDVAQRALQIHPNDVPSLRVLAIVHSGLGELDRAHPILKRAQQLDPNSAAELNNLALNYFWLNDFDHSSEWDRRALTVNPDDLYSHLRLAMVDVLLGRASDARRRITSMVSADTAQLAHVVADIALMLGDYDVARSRYTHSLELATRAPSMPQSSNGRGPKRFTMVNSWFLSTSLAYTLLKAGDSTHANALLTEAADVDRQELQAGNESSMIKYDLAVVNALQGNTPEALTWLEEAVSAGYRLHAALVLDPRTERIRQEPRFRRAVDRVRQDVDSMRRLVRQPAR